MGIPLRTHNRLLDLLSSKEMARLWPFLTKVSHEQDECLYEARAPIGQVYFPIDCAASALNSTLNDEVIEVATIGNEGLIGHWIAVKEATSIEQVIIQVSGASWRMAAEDLDKLLGTSTELRDVLRRYHLAYSFQVNQCSACNGLHPLQRRCCRWLLMTRDRIGSNEVPLTHQYLGYMLGVRRTNISDVMAPLQAAGLIRSKKGVVTLLDSAGLEARACECYQVIRGHYERLLRYA